MIGVQVDLVETPAMMASLISTHCYIHLIKKLCTATYVRDIKRGIRGVLEAALKAQPEYASLIDSAGTLRTELGILDNTGKVEGIIKLWLNSVDVTLTPIGPGTPFVCAVTAIQTDLSDVISSVFAKYNTEKGQTINWLEWLLKMGDSIIVRDYTIWPDAAHSRTNSVVMRRKGSVGWRVPPAYSGTEANNWTTRAIDSAEGAILRVLYTETVRRL